MKSPPDMYTSPNSRKIRARILGLLTDRFDQADSHSAKARTKYKHFADRVLRHEPFYNTVESVFSSRLPTKTKTARKEQMDKAQ